MSREKIDQKLVLLRQQHESLCSLYSNWRGHKCHLPSLAGFVYLLQCDDVMDLAAVIDKLAPRDPTVLPTSQNSFHDLEFPNLEIQILKTMARAYQEAHILDSLSASVKALQTQVNELTRVKGIHEEKLKNLTAANEALTKKNGELELRIKAKCVVSPLWSRSSSRRPCS